MKLNEENGVKLEIKRSEINALNKLYFNLVQLKDLNLEAESLKKVINILPSDDSVGVVFDHIPTHPRHIVEFRKLSNDRKEYISIPEQNWIIEEDEP